jgi:hypothetical protein
MNKTLEHLYHSLLFCLGQEYERYQELIKVISEESVILIKSRLEDILEFNTQKERVLLSLNVAKEMRVDVFNKVIAHLNLEEPVSMRQLMAYAPDDTRQNLIHYQEKFSDLMGQIEKINKNNMGLINFSLSQLNSTLNYINALTSSSPNYDHCGQIKAGNLQGRLISQEG